MPRHTAPRRRPHRRRRRHTLSQVEKVTLLAEAVREQRELNFCRARVVHARGRRCRVARLHPARQRQLWPTIAGRGHGCCRSIHVLHSLQTASRRRPRDPTFGRTPNRNAWSASRLARAAYQSEVRGSRRLEPRLQDLVQLEVTRAAQSIPAARLAGCGKTRPINRVYSSHRGDDPGISQSLCSLPVHASSGHAKPAARWPNS